MANRFTVMVVLSLDDYLDIKPTLSLRSLLSLSRSGRAVRYRGRVVGSIVRVHGKTYVTERYERDVFRKLGTIGISDEILRMLRAENVSKIAILVKNNNGDFIKGYLSDILDWYEKGIGYWWEQGKELQRHLKLEKMETMPL
ncbi:MAG: hypothetical protein QXD32_07660 [Nitrososphaerota archaeon]